MKASEKGTEAESELEPENESESDLDSLRREALKVMEKKRRQSSDNEEDIESVIEATTMEVIKDMEETENNGDVEIETSTGNDILIENLKRRRNKH